VLDEGHHVLTCSRTRSGIASSAAAATIAVAAAGTAVLGAFAPVQPVRAAVIQPATRQAADAPVAIPSGASARLDSELQQAWQISKGGGVIVAVLSTGVSPISVLAGKVIKGPDYAPAANPVLTDGTVYAALIAGSGPTSATPSGTIGRAPAARILDLRVAAYGSPAAVVKKYEMDGTWQGIEAKAIRYAASHGAKVIVMDESGGDATQGLASAVAYAVARKAVILTPDYYSTSAATFPDDLPGVINVAGTVLKGFTAPRTKVRFDVSPSVLLAAPANTSTTTGPGNGQWLAWGSFTTMAWAAGTVALIKSVYPQITPAMMDRALAESASYRPAGGYSTSIGFGLINPVGALHAAGRLVSLRTAAKAGPGVLSPGARFSAAAPPGTIDAVRHSPAQLGAFAAAIVVGLVLVVLAVALRRRWREAAAAAAAPVSDSR
jgi:subtilase family protein